MKKVVSFPIGSRNVLSRLKKFTSVDLLGGARLSVFLFDSRLPAAKRPDCNTCVICVAGRSGAQELDLVLKFSNISSSPLDVAQRMHMTRTKVQLLANDWQRHGGNVFTGQNQGLNHSALGFYAMPNWN
jgi:hypothetical protein